MPAPPTPKRVSQKFLPRTGERDDSQLPYLIIDRYVANHHPHLAQMNIAVNWHYSLKPGPDGKMILGSFKICSDLERQMHNFDGIMTLNYTWWHHPTVQDSHREALVDHELCHPRVMMDEDAGAPKLDELGKIRYFNARHDIEDFEDVVTRHGLWKNDLERMARTMVEALERQNNNPELPLPAPANPETEIDNLPV
jgi:hypothetical protein